VHFLVVGAQLQILDAFAEHLPFERRSAGRLHGLADDRRVRHTQRDHAQEFDEPGELRPFHRIRRHSLRGNTLVDQLDQLRIVEPSQPLGERRPHLASAAIAAMTHAAAGLERLLSDSLCVRLCPGVRRHQQRSE
jgi:hypothetical protein